MNGAARLVSAGLILALAAASRGHGVESLAGRTLIGIGLSYDPEGGTSDDDGAWTTSLPSTAPAGPGPTPAPTPTPDPGGCGPG